MDLHDKKQPDHENDDLKEDLLDQEFDDEETNDILDEEEDKEELDDEDEESAVKDDGAATSKKGKNLGVYIAMGLCLVALGVGAWATYDTVVKISDVTHNTASSAAPNNSTAEVNQNVSGVPKDNNNMEDDIPTVENKASSQDEASSEVASEEPPESKAPELYNYPIAGSEILNGFSNNDPVYNMTMDDWRTHDGLDIGAEKGQNVMSIGAGTVMDSYEDMMWGNVLVIQHGDIEVRYCGLADKSTLAAGDKVEDGQILGTVGVIPIEEKEGPHLHIQMKKDGVWIDPTRVLKAS